MRRAAKIDANQPEIVAFFEAAGAEVAYTFREKNLCDFFVSYLKETAAVEVKDGAKPPSQRKLSKGEKKFKKRWERTGTYAEIHNIEQARELLGTMAQVAKWKRMGRIQDGKL